MAAQLTAAYPHYWPETIRALMVHSARWTGHMYQLVAQCATKREKADCLRRFGYGIPDLGRAMASAIDDLALVAQNTIVRSEWKAEACDLTSRISISFLAPGRA
jgi:hypothetical protein